MVATRNATDLVIIAENRALAKKAIRMAKITKGSVFAVTAGIDNPPNSITRPGLLPRVKKTAVDVKTNPIARIPVRSSMASPARAIVKDHQLNLSLGVINERLRPTLFSTLQV
jgi:hypothetical protein